MSRHTIPHPTIAGRKLAYGYDRPLSYYFWQVFDGDHPDPGNIVDSDNFSGCSGQEMVDAAEHYGFSLPEGHRVDAMLDLPITDMPIPDDWKPEPIPGWTPPAPWTWGKDSAETQQGIERVIESTIAQLMDDGDLSTVSGPDGKTFRIRVLIEMVPEPDEGE